uniref:Ovule protein n=1 Tax=Strongyloides venezuelensis TaxID=75913 RepID=A0A0K0G598_STRVS
MITMTFSISNELMGWYSKVYQHRVPSIQALRTNSGTSCRRNDRKNMEEIKSPCGKMVDSISTNRLSIKKKTN